MFIVGIVFLLAAITVLVYFIYKHKGGATPGVVSELDSIYFQAKQKGMTKQQVTKQLLAKGWSQEVLDKYLKRGGK